MRDMVVSTFDSFAGRLVLGFVNACSVHPVLSAALLAALLALAVLLCVEVFRTGRTSRG